MEYSFEQPYTEVKMSQISVGRLSIGTSIDNIIGMSIDNRTE